MVLKKLNYFLSKNKRKILISFFILLMFLFDIFLKEEDNKKINWIFNFTFFFSFNIIYEIIRQKIEEKSKIGLNFFFLNFIFQIIFFGLITLIAYTLITTLSLEYIFNWKPIIFSMFSIHFFYVLKKINLKNKNYNN